MSDNENLPNNTPDKLIEEIYPVVLTTSKRKTVLKLKIEEFVETNCRTLMLNRKHKLGLILNEKYINAKEAFPAEAMRSFYEYKPCKMGNYPLDHSQPIPSYFQPKSFNQIIRKPNR
ncbi:unnamed protein product [Brachionus calyciflorus]|uniref:Uncharacterized protein n=1 Tax=Brachionus calyciflorus TaxID=104777 RepID=A0A813SUP5_9BILA|nr:unnamed protein product [Brachionus calyciflorus]